MTAATGAFGLNARPRAWASPASRKARLYSLVLKLAAEDLAVQVCRVGDREVLVPLADIGIADGAVSKPGQRGTSSSRRRSRLRSAY